MTDNKHKRSFRKEYLNDIQKDTSGRYAYTGSFMDYSEGAGKWRQDNILLWTACLIPAILLIIAGCIPQGGLTGNFLIIIPYALEFIALFICIWKLVRMTYAGMHMRSYVHEQTVKVLPGYLAAAAAVAALALAGAVVSLIMGTFAGSAFGAVIYIAAQILLAGGAIFSNHRIRAMKWYQS